MEATSNVISTTTDHRDDVGTNGQRVDDAFKLSMEGTEATPLPVTRNHDCHSLLPNKDIDLRPTKDKDQHRGRNDETLEMSNAESSNENDLEEVGQNRLVNLSADLDEDVFEDNEKEETHQLQGGESSQAGPAAARAKVVRRLSFSSSSGENDAKKLKTSSGSARENKKATRKPPKSKSKKAGLVFSVSRAHNRLKQDRYATRVRVNAAVYMAATLEYLVAEVLELAGNCARFYQKKRVTPRHIQLTLIHDLELGELTKGVIVPEGGVKENNIATELLPRPSNNTTCAASEEERRLDSEI